MSTHRAQCYDFGDDAAHVVAEMPHGDVLRMEKGSVRSSECTPPLLPQRAFKSMMLMCLYISAPRRRLTSIFSRLIASNNCARCSNMSSRGRRLDNSSAAISCTTVATTVCKSASTRLE